MDKQAQEIFFQEIMEKHKGILLKVARVYCIDLTDRQDLLQEMKIQIWLSVHRYDDQFKLSTWLYRICLNVAISFYRKSSVSRSKFQTIQDEHLNQVNEENDDSITSLERLDQLISQLNEFDRALILLYLEEKSYREIAEIMGLSESNVGTKLGRIRERMRNTIITT